MGSLLPPPPPSTGNRKFRCCPKHTITGSQRAGCRDSESDHCPAGCMCVHVYMCPIIPGGQGKDIRSCEISYMCECHATRVSSETINECSEYCMSIRDSRDISFSCLIKILKQHNEMRFCDASEFAYSAK
ncbi:hypothetical protein PoB_004732900 [Plakobranchus ocellatus]|uniref:Uncharacterized protein n=1 Tax=Plakobranchus ocellatus TaxID=259542 RepID=A0AAV4BKZ7_9GAST|nr:hypothetical protein PoB_004732900 [Plakobranchus ocellatus]